MHASTALHYFVLVYGDGNSFNLRLLGNNQIFQPKPHTRLNSLRLPLHACRGVAPEGRRLDRKRSDIRISYQLHKLVNVTEKVGTE